MTNGKTAWLPDVNVMVYAINRRAPQHEDARQWFDRTLARGDVITLPDLAAAGCVRVATRAIQPEPHEPPAAEQALAFLDTLGSHIAVRSIAAGSKWWPIFRRLVRRSNATGNLVTDAHFAALAMEHGSVMTSFDNDFARFPGLTWLHLPGAQLVTNPT